MAILTSDIAAFRAQLAPVAQLKADYVIDPKTVRYFPKQSHDIQPDWSGGNLIAIIKNATFNLDNGLPIEEIKLEQITDDELDAQCEQYTGQPMILNTTRIVTEAKSPLAWSIDALITDNPWDLLTASKLIQFSKEQGGDLAIARIMQDGLEQLAIYGDKVRPEVEKMARMIMRAAKTDLHEITDELKEVEGADGFPVIMRTPAKSDKRPADVYRAWMTPLYLLRKAKCHVFSLMSEIIAAQTLPLSELDAPAWVDRYTGIADTKEEFVTLQTSERDEEPLSPEELAMSFSEGYDRDDVDSIENDDVWSGETIGEESAEGVTFKMQADYKPTSAFDELRHESMKYVTPCKQVIKDLKAKAQARINLGLINDEGVCEWTAEWVSAQFHKSTEANEFLMWMRSVARPEAKVARMILRAWAEMTPEAIEKVAMVSDVLKLLKERYAYLFAKTNFTTRSVNKDGKKAIWKTLGTYNIDNLDDAILAIMALKQAAPSSAIVQPLRDLTAGADPRDLVMIFLGLDHDFGFNDEDMQSIRLEKGNLFDFYEEHGDAIIDAMGDGYYCTTTSEDIINLIPEWTIQGYLDKCPVDGNPVQSKAFNEGFLRVAIGAKSLTFKNKAGKTTNSASEAGWDAWRQSKSPKGNAAYHLALAEGKPQDQAMLAFKAASKAEHGEKIVEVSPSGLVLASKRKIDWRIAAMKLKAGELRMPEEQRSVIKDFLVERGLAPAFVAML